MKNFHVNKINKTLSQKISDIIGLCEDLESVYKNVGLNFKITECDNGILFKTKKDDKNEENIKEMVNGIIINRGMNLEISKLEYDKNLKGYILTLNEKTKKQGFTNEFGIT